MGFDIDDERVQQVIAEMDEHNGPNLPAGVVLQCPACPHCGLGSYVVVDEDEYAWLANGVPISEALSAHPAPVRELCISGLHEPCWDLYVGNDE